MFHDQIAVVTGAASGIGAALCHKLAQAGARVVACDVDLPGVTAVAAAIRDAGGVAEAARLDVANAAEVEALAAQTVERHGRIDLWFNNAGVGIGGATEDLQASDWKHVLDVNLAGVIHGVQAAYPRMVRQGFGHIINTASVAGFSAYPFALPYTTSKHAVLGLSRALRAEARELGVRVSVVCPGAIKTAIWQRSEVRGVLARGRAKLLDQLPIFMSAERCAEVALRGVASNRAIILVTAEAHVAWWLGRVSPELSGWLSYQLARRVRKVARRAI